MAQHVFMECSAYESERRHFQKEITKINIQLTIDDIFSSDVSKVKDQIEFFFCFK